METIIKNLIRELTKKTAVSGKKPLLVLLGPTASGKTALSIEIAKEFNGEIISADSRQVYRYMNIGTDKIPPELREGIPHHLIDVANPDERFTVVDFMRLADRAISEILQRGALPILCGGTGLYINAVTENFQIPETGDNRDVRKKLEADLAEHDKEWLHNELKKVDPETAAKIPAGSHLYVLRALEIFQLTGKPKSDKKGAPKYKTLKIGLRWPKEILAERIAGRVEEQFKNGLIEETKKLLDMGYSLELQSMRSLGYREVATHLNGKISLKVAPPWRGTNCLAEPTLGLEEAKKLIVTNTVKFSKRQMTWFKKDKEIVWMDNMSS